MSSGIRSVDISLRDARPADSVALQSLDGAAPDSGAALIQARRNFFARTAAYSRCRTYVAESNGQIVGVNCVALNPVRVAGRPCMAGYSFNTRVAPSMRGRGIGSPLPTPMRSFVPSVSMRIFVRVALPVFTSTSITLDA